MRHLSLIAVLALVTGCHGFYNVTGQHQRKALAEAQAFAEDDPELNGSPVECKKHDSEKDGYVTCTVHGPSGRVTLECPTRKFIRLAEDHGCKETIRLTGLK